MRLTWALCSVFAVSEPTTQQVELYARASAAFDEGRYQDVVADLNQALAQGSINILWLSLGRAHQKLGQCRQARDAYLAVPKASAIDEPPRAQVDARAAAYLQELQDTCPGTAVVTCAHPDAEVGLAENQMQPCTDVGWSLSPGRHRIYARAGASSAQFEIEVVAFEETRLAIGLEPPAPPDPEKKDDHPPRRSSLLLAGQVTFGVGLATAMTSLILDLALVGPSVRRFDRAREQGDPQANSLRMRARSQQIGTLVGYVLGGVMTVTGASLWGVAARRRARSAVALGIELAPGGGSVSATGRF